MDYKKQHKLIVDTALLAGKILMQSGSETARVEDTMERILQKALPPDQAHEIRVFVMLNAVFVGVDSLRTSFLQIKTRSYNLDKVTQVNQISRDFSSDKMTIEDTWKNLYAIHKHKENPISVKMLVATALLGGSTAPLFGGVLADAPAAALAAVVSYLVYNVVRHYIDIPFICEFFAAFVGGVAGVLCLQLIGIHPDKIMMGAVIPLVPGIAITNSIRDIMGRHYLTGLIRFVECMFIGASLGGGIAVVYVLFSSWL